MKATGRAKAHAYAQGSSRAQNHAGAMRMGGQAKEKTAYTRRSFFQVLKADVARKKTICASPLLCSPPSTTCSRKDPFTRTSAPVFRPGRSHEFKVKAVVNQIASLASKSPCSNRQGGLKCKEERKEKINDLLTWLFLFRSKGDDAKQPSDYVVEAGGGSRRDCCAEAVSGQRFAPDPWARQWDGLGPAQTRYPALLTHPTTDTSPASAGNCRSHHLQRRTQEGAAASNPHLRGATFAVGGGSQTRSCPHRLGPSGNSNGCHVAGFDLAAAPSALTLNDDGRLALVRTRA